MRLNVLSETEQRVWTPGVEMQAVFAPASNHVLSTGLTFYRDRSSDRRTTTTTTTMIGQVVMGQRGPAPVVFPSPVQLGPPSVAHPVRVPDASLRDIAVFAQDEWRVRPNVSLVAGLRGDFYNVTSKATPGYDVAAVVAGATPAIDPSTLPNPTGATYARKALTGDIGLVANTEGSISPFVRFGRSYRHPNLEEMFFAGPATAGNIAPNVKVKPEQGNNFDAGAKFNFAGVSGGTYVFLNQYKDFIVQDLTTATTPAGPLVQATNYGDVRIHGLEVSGDAPVSFDQGVLTLNVSAAFTRGTITRGINPLDKSPLDGKPADNITPVKAIGSVRFTEPRGRWWVEYGVRTQTRRETHHAHAASVPVPHRTGSAVARWFHCSTHRLGAEPRTRTRSGGLHLCRRKSDRRVLPRTFSVRAIARTKLHCRYQHRRILKRNQRDGCR